MQSKKQSIMESMLNMISGACIAFTITQIGSIMGFWDISPESNVGLTITLTVVSVIRSYYWRRLFNKKAVQNVN